MAYGEGKCWHCGKWAYMFIHRGYIQLCKKCKDRVK